MGKIKESKYLTELITKQISDGVWQLTEPLIYQSKYLNCIMEVPAGFYTDLASVPRVPIAFMLWGMRSHREAVVHDYLYRSNSNPVVTVAQADRVFLEAMAVREKAFYIRYPMFIGVRVGGWLLFHKRKVESILK